MNHPKLHLLSFEYKDVSNAYCPFKFIVPWDIFPWSQNYVGSMFHVVKLPLDQSSGGRKFRGIKVPRGQSSAGENFHVGEVDQEENSMGAKFRGGNIPWDQGTGGGGNSLGANFREGQCSGVKIVALKDPRTIYILGCTRNQYFSIRNRVKTVAIENNACEVSSLYL